MKNCLISILLFIQLSGYSNEWELINPNSEYHYSSGYSVFPDYSLKVDSFVTAGADTIFYFNRVIADCETCADPDEIYANVPNLFDYSCLKSNNNYSFFPRKNFLINSDLPIDSSWVFDSVRNISAHISRAISGFTFGQTDSLKVIQLSIGDSICISKKFGITRFYNIDSSKYYNLIGIKFKEERLGILPPDYSSIYNFDVGDVFCYDENNSSYTDEPTSYFSRKKIEITGRKYEGTSIIYQRKVKGMNWAEFSSFPSGDTNFYTINDEVTYSDNESDPVNYARFQYFSFLDLNYFGFTNYYIDKQDDRRVKYFGDNFFDESQTASVYYQNSYMDSLKMNQPFRIISEFSRIGLCFKEGLGMALYTASIGEVMERNSLVGYKKGLEKFGKVYEDWELTGTEIYKDKIKLSVLPSIFDEKIYIQSEIAGNYTFEIFSVSGRKVFFENIFVSHHSMIQLGFLERGIYFLRISNGSDLYFNKVIIKK